MTKHFVFIVNPRSGTERVKVIESAVRKAFAGTAHTHDIQFTQHAKHGAALAAEAARAGAYAVVAVGGDGSVADVAEGLLHTQTVLGIVPKGSGNGLARALKIPLKTEAATALLARAQERTIDVGFAGEKLFLSNAGVGFDTVVSQAFQMSERRGLSSYASLVARHLRSYKPMKYRITLDGEKVIEERAFLLTVANGSQLGYNFRIAPAALLDDGLLDVVIVRPFPLILGGAISLRAWMGTILKSRYVRHYRAREVLIHHPDLSVMQCDGDPHPCSANVVVRLEERALRVLAP